MHTASIIVAVMMPVRVSEATVYLTRLNGAISQKAVIVILAVRT
jgi:hypothetical protein